MDDARGPGNSTWAWDQPVPLRWLLVDEYTPDIPDTAVAVCTDIDGLFVPAPEPPPVERYTLVGCEPAGRLRAALDGGPGTWLGNLVLDGVHHPDRPYPAGCDPVPVGCCACMEELLDLTVAGHRPSATPGLVDVDLDGRLRADRQYTGRTTAEPPDAAGYVLAGDGDERWGTCRDVAGVFRERPEPPQYAAVLRGCRPEPPLRAALDAAADSPRRRIATSILGVADDGTPARSGAGLYGSVTGARPSTLGSGLLDVTFGTGVHGAMPTGARPVWERRWAGGPTEPGEWAALDRELRHQWSGVALAHHRDDVPDRPGGTTYHLDGRHVTDIEGFYCAIGEAVNGPGGYFGWNAHALHDCVRGGYGAAPPIRLVWHDSAVARARMAPGYDRHRWAPAISLDDLLRWLTEDGVVVELR